MPGCPLRRTCARPLEGARRSRSKAKARRPTGRPVCGVRSPLRVELADRPSSRASSLPQGTWLYTDFAPDTGQLWDRRTAAPTKKQRQNSPHRAASHHSSGRALARLQLLILIHPPPRQAERRRSSGGGRAAPFGAAEHIERRSSEADRRRCPRMNAGAKEPRAQARGRTFGASVFWVTFLGACKKSDSPSGRNHKPPLPQQRICTQSTHNPGRPEGRQGHEQTQTKLLLTTSNTSLDNCPEARIRSNSPFIKA